MAIPPTACRRKPMWSAGALSRTPFHIPITSHGLFLVPSGSRRQRNTLQNSKRLPCRPEQMAKKNNETAKELWEQMFAKSAKGENAALMEVDYDPSEDEAKMIKGLQEAGWPQDHIDMRL